jgi:hypothetical protein
MGPGYSLREDLLPIALLTTTRSLRAEDAESVIGCFRSLAARRIRYVSITDVRGAHAMPDALTRRRFAEASASFEPLSRVWSLGNAIVLNSEIVRHLLLAIEWVSRPESPMVYFTDLRSAIDWAIERLEAAGIPVTPAILAFRDEAR